MATFTVTTAADVVNASDGVLSLREAVSQANATAAADTIQFTAAIEGHTLVLTQGELLVTQDLTIDGNRDDNASAVTIDGNSSDRIIATAANAAIDLRLTDLTLRHGGGYDDGGAVLVRSASLTMTRCNLTDNVSESGSGGALAILSGGRVLIQQSTLTGNYAEQGGAILSDGANSLIIRGSRFENNDGEYGGGAIMMLRDGSLVVEDTIARDNGRYGYADIAGGGFLQISDGSAQILRSALVDNRASNGGAVWAIDSSVAIVDSTVADNAAVGPAYGTGGGVLLGGSSELVLRNSTVTANLALESSGDSYYSAAGGGIYASSASRLDIANSIVAGNVARSTAGTESGDDIFGTITFTNGHNLFGSDVAGNNPGDREGIASALIFAALDPDTGGGQVNPQGFVSFKNASSNPALSGADLLAAAATAQLGGARPQPAGSLPDIGSTEFGQALSTTASANNDVLTGTAAGNAINGLLGNDYLRGLGGNDTLHGNEGSDLLDGGAGNDQLYGDAAIDIVYYGGTAKVTVDLSLATDKATRGSETDTLFSIEGAIGSSGADIFKGNEFNNFFQGGGGKDTATGGGGRDLYDLNAVADSAAGTATRDVITDFVHLTDRVDLMGIDADGAVAGNQAFRWVGTAALTGPGQLGYFTSGGNTIIRASTDADAASELEIQLTGIKTLSAADFYL